MDLSTCELVKQSFAQQLQSKHNIEGIGIGHKWVNGVDTQVPAILVFVQQKLDKDNVISKYSANDFIPTTIDGVPTDVIEVGYITKQAFRGRIRPIKPGYSIGHPNVTAGTLGGIFLDKDNDYVVLSNNHVIADENRAKLGDIILQPARSDSFGDMEFSGWKEPVSNLPYFANLKDVTNLLSSGNKHDSAIAKIHPSIIKDNLIDFNYPEVNRPIKGFRDTAVGMKVQKFGRTTGRTKGTVMGVKASFSVAYDFGSARFEDCIVCTNMSSGGDSGSIILDEEMNAIGLLFAGSPKVTIASPIQNVVSRYGLKLPGLNNANSLASINWKTAGHGINISQPTNSMSIATRANEAAYIETNLPYFSKISLKINTGDDKGATWGPGASIIWDGGFLKLNLRYSTTFGCTTHASESLGIGKTIPNHEYKIVFKLDRDGLLVGEIHDGDKVFLMHKIKINSNRITLKIGKMNGQSGLSNHSELGNPGTSRYYDLLVE